MKEIGEIIRVAREKKRWTQEQMAAKMGISMRQYNKYEAGKLPKYKSTVAEQIDKLIGTNIKELIYEQNVPRATENGHQELRDEGDGNEYTPKQLDLVKEVIRLKDQQLALEATLNVVSSELVPLVAKLTGRSHANVSLQLKKDVDAETVRLINLVNKRK